MALTRYGVAVLTVLGFSGALAQEAPPAAKLADQLRMPWTRGSETFLRQWIVAGPFPCALEKECVSGEATLQPADGQEQRRSDGTTVRWHSQKAWGDEVTFDEMAGADGALAYAFTKVSRPAAGRALLSVGSGDGVRVWVNGQPVLVRDGLRSATPDEDQIEVEMTAGENAILVKLGARSSLYARVLEPGTVVARVFEIGPSLVALSPEGFTLKTDIGAQRTDVEAVRVEVIRPGGKTVFTTTAPRGATIPIDARAWTDGPYEVRCTTHSFAGLLYAAHLPWYKGESLTKARELEAAAAVADASRPEGATLQMLLDMVEDRLGSKLNVATGNPWPKIHSPLMEYDELMLERNGAIGRIRPHGFVRLAYRDEVDGTTQFCRAYLPADYDSARKWPLVIQMHGYNAPNPPYVRWWSADKRHAGIDTEFSNHQGVIYIEPHGRANTQYLGIGDSDILHAIAEAKRLFSVDDDRVYLTGDSMGGWGTWNVASRHPDLFAAIAPVFGGVDYHSTMSEEDLAKLSPLDRFSNEKQSSWAMADGLLNMPIMVDHGDADQAVNVEYSRWALRLLQRWGYDVRYHEFPGRVHEALESQNGNMNIEWFLRHRRNPNPSHVRIRSAELRNASAYWVQVRQAADPLAFMVVDAQIVGRNIIRLDTDNVLDIELTPGTPLVDRNGPVQVVWNGVTRTLRSPNATLRLTAAGYDPAGLRKTPRLPGSTADFTLTPFAVVIGTISKDKEMAALCSQKAEAFVETWRTWQRQKPRVFKDTEITEADLARYSLLLIGGPEANRITARLATKLPLQISTDRITIDGKTFPVQDAAVQMLYPNPLNADAYVWVAASSSTNGMYFASPNPQRAYDWDYIIVDGHIPAHGQSASSLQTRVVSGMFDHHWRFSDSLAQPGDVAIRANGRLRHRPNARLRVDPKALDAYVGRYSIEKGPTLEVRKDGNRLVVTQQGQPAVMEMLPETASSFCIPGPDAWVSFTRDATGKVIGFVGYQDGDFEGTKLD